MNSRTVPMMKCGCAAVGTCSSKGGLKFDPPVPACITHDCIEVSDNQPDLTGRMARCDYHGRGGFRNHGPIYGGGNCSRDSCRCIVPSSLELPFFVYQGAGSLKAKETCKCGTGLALHWPRWRAMFRVIRRWFKIDMYQEDRTEERNLPDIDYAKQWAENERDRLLKSGDGPRIGYEGEPTKVRSVELLALQEIPNPLHVKPCADFRPAGPAEYDSFFCGCAGWD